MPPGRELTALLDLLDPFVAGADEVVGDRPSSSSRLGDRKPAGRRERRDCLGEGGGAGDDDRVGFAPSASRASIRSPTRCGGGSRASVAVPREGKPDPARVR